MQAKEVYGDKLVTPLDVSVEHSSRGTKFNSRKGPLDSEKATHLGFQVAVGENWLLGELMQFSASHEPVSRGSVQ
jgi:hypothetical protein